MRWAPGTVKWGAYLLTVWAGAQMMLATMILLAVIGFGEQPLIARILFEEGEWGGLAVHIRQAIRALAILFNASVLGFEILLIWTVWAALMRGQSWARWAAALTLVLVQALGWAASAEIGYRTLVPELAVNVFGFAGLALTVVVLKGPQSRQP
jgi:hypothetical protein